MKKKIKVAKKHRKSAPEKNVTNLFKTQIFDSILVQICNKGFTNLKYFTLKLNLTQKLTRKFSEQMLNIRKNQNCSF